MKKYLLLLLSLVVFTSSHAQTQQGYVKTKGRLTTNGTVIPGVRLSGATIVLGSRNPVTSLKDGVFSFPTSGKNFLVRDIKKNGYQLYDRDQLKSYAYSSNPLILVLEKPEEYEQDKLQKQQQISRTLRRQLAKREDEIERLKEEKKISEAEYNRLYNELYTNEKKNQNLIEDMAKRYAAMDFDNMDETNLKIKTFILNGELERADSLINSKGSLEDRLKDYQKLQKANQQEEEAIAQRQENLDKSKELAKKTFLDLAEDCFNKFEVCKLQNKFDSAAYYIEERANLDSTNWEWQFDAAIYFQDQKEFDKAERYHILTLSILETNESQTNDHMIAFTKGCLAQLYKDTQRFAESEMMYHEALNILQPLFIDNPGLYDVTLAWTRNNLGVLYKETQRFTESETMYKAALEIYEKMDNTKNYNSEGLCITLNSLGELYRISQRFDDSEKSYKQALDICEKLVKVNPKLYKPYLGGIQANLGRLYDSTNRQEESEKLLKSASNIYEELAQENPMVYESDLATTLMSLGILFFKTDRFDESESMLTKATDIFEKLTKKCFLAYEANLANVQLCLASLYFTKHKYNECKVMYKSALINYEKLDKNIPGKYKKQIADAQMYLATIYMTLGQYKEAYNTYKECIILLPLLCKKGKISKEQYSYILYGLSSCAIAIGKFDESEYYSKEALTLTPNHELSYTNIAAIYLLKGRFIEAEKLYRKYKEKYKELLYDNILLFAEQGVIPKEREADVERIKQLLSE